MLVLSADPAGPEPKTRRSRVSIPPGCSQRRCDVVVSAPHQRAVVRRRGSPREFERLQVQRKVSFPNEARSVAAVCAACSMFYLDPRAHCPECRRSLFFCRATEPPMTPWVGKLLRVLSGAIGVTAAGLVFSTVRKVFAAVR